MKFIQILILSTYCSFSFAGIHVWTDENGKKHFSDQKPQNMQSEEKIIKSKTVNDHSSENKKLPSRDDDSINIKLNSIKGKLYAIYNKGLKNNPNLKGAVTFTFNIDPSGKVSNSIIKSELISSSVNSNFLNVINEIDFGNETVSSTSKSWTISFLPF